MIEEEANAVLPMCRHKYNSRKVIRQQGLEKLLNVFGAEKDSKDIGRRVVGISENERIAASTIEGLRRIANLDVTSAGS